MVQCIVVPYILEGGIGRVLKHHGGHYAVLSASRGDRSAAHNARKTRHLGRMLRKLGYGYKPVVGHGQEVSAFDGYKPSKEKSFFVPKMHAKLAARIARVYRQDAILAGSKNKHRLISTTRGKRAKRDMTFNKTKLKSAEYHTSVSKKGGWSGAAKKGKKYHHSD